MTRRVYAGVPAHERSAERRAKLLAAALELIGTEGSAAATVRAVCQGAKLTPRYFYESFDDREALIGALLEQVATEAAQAIVAEVAAADDDAQAKARAAIGAFVAFLEDDPRRARLLFTEALGSEPLMERRVALLRTFAALIGDQAIAFYGGGPSPVVDLTALLLAGGLAEVLLAWLAGELPMTRAELVEDLATLFSATGAAAVDIARRRG